MPLFVLGFDKNKNEVIVGEENELLKREVIIDDVNLLAIDEIKKPLDVEVKTRYSQKASKAIIENYQDSKIKITFENPARAITPGQSAVFYDNDIVIGGGKILS